MYGENLRFEYAHFNSLDFGSYGLGASVSPMGSQLMTTNTAINWGLQHLEINLGTQMSFERGHLAQLGKIEREELIRLAKLNRVTLSIHAPHFCAAGGQINAASETNRIKAVQEFKTVLDFADQIGRGMNIENIPVVIHAVEGIPGNPMPKEVLHIIHQETGQIIPIEKREVVYPKEFFEKYGLKEGVDYERIPGTNRFYLYPEGRLKIQNRQLIEDLEYRKAYAEYLKKYHKKFLDEALKNYAEAPPEIKKELKKRIEEETRIYKAAVEEAERTKLEIDHLRKKYYDEKTGELKIFTLTDEFAKNQAVKTFVELGLEAYKKPTKPMIVVENFFPELALSDPKMLGETVKEIRKKLAEELVRKVGLSREKAIEEARRLIGMNLDIGHVNLWKKYGKKDKEILEEIDKIYPLVKHVHITDNFGDYDAHLPVGWGNAPIKQIIEKLRKKGWKGRAILETFGATQYGGQGFGVVQSMYTMGLPLIPGGPTWEMAEGTYFQAGYAFTTGPILPDVNFQIYGVGFSGLPYATGAALPGKRPGEKFAGAPMS